MYHSPFYITENHSSNAFSFEKRNSPKIYVPSIIDGRIEDVKIGTEVVFEDFDEHGKLQSCIGLQNFIRAKHPQTGKPVIIVDNHNHVFYFWYEACQRGEIERGITLVHIDAHRDTRIPERNMTADEAKDLKSIFNYTNSVLNVGNYIPPAMEEGLIGNLVSITSERELEVASPTGNFILNIDLDFWAPEMDYIDRKKTMEIIRPWMKAAQMITVSTSPFFIEQERAIGILHELFAVGNFVVN